MAASMGSPTSSVLLATCSDIIKTWDLDRQVGMFMLNDDDDDDDDDEDVNTTRGFLLSNYDRVRYNISKT